MSNRPFSLLHADQTTTNKTRVPVSEIEAAVRDIRHGTVQIIIQDGKVVQIDKTEKIRLS